MSAKRGVAVAGPPIVDLLPPEVAERARDRSRLSWSLLLLVLVIALVVVGTGFAAIRNTTAQSALSTAQAQGAAIVAEQQQYVEIRDVQESISFVEEARLAGTSTEIAWVPLVAELAALLPADTAFLGFRATAPEPWTPLAVQTGPLRPPLSGSIVLVVRAGSVAPIAQFATALKGLDIVADVSFDAITSEEAVDGTITVNLNELALAQRFAEEVSE